MKINPVYKKELKISVRTIKMAMIIFGYNFILALIGLFAFYVVFDLNQRHGGAIKYEEMLTIYTIIAVIEFGLILFIVPAITSSAISGERERQTLEILLTTRLSPLRIILGKLAASISTVILLIISSIPILSVVFAIGGITFRDLIELIFLTVVTGIFIGSIGIFFSTLFRKTTISTIFTYGTIIVLILGTIAVLGAIYIVADMNMNYYTIVSDQNVDLGNLILILLINPGVTLISLFGRQYGGPSYLDQLLDNFGTCNSFVESNWFYISILVQLGLSILLIVWSSKLLNPIKKKKRTKY